MNSKTIRNKIDALEALQDIVTSIDDMQADDSLLVNLSIKERGNEQFGITVAHGIPREIMLAGLRAMRDELQRQVEPQKVAA